MMNPKDTQEVQRMVEELLAKRMVIESPCLCPSSPNPFILWEDIWGWEWCLWCRHWRSPDTRRQVIILFQRETMWFYGEVLYLKEFCAIIRCLEQWNHYLIANESILHSDLWSIPKGSTSQCKECKVGGVLAVIPFHHQKHKSGKLNEGADALSRRHLLLFQLQTSTS